LGRYRSLALLVSLIVSGPAATLRAGDDPKPQAPTATPTPPATGGAARSSPEVAARPEPPIAPRKYLEAGSRLFNAGRFELASKYFQAAEMYRDRLTASEQIVLDVYKEKLEHYLQSPTASAVAKASASPAALGAATPGAPASAADAAVVTASTVARSGPLRATGVGPVESSRPDDLESLALETVPTASAAVASPSREGPTAGGPLGASGAWRDTTDTKQKARWLLQLAREQTFKGHFDIAERAVAEARGLDVKWTLFDETPDRVADAIAKARSKADPNATAAAAPPHDRRTARARLKEARAALAANDLDRAEDVVRDVRSWGVSYGLFDDTPDKISAALFEARRREAVRNAELTVRTYDRGAARPQAAPDDPTPRTRPPVAPGTDGEN
jgi:hypothetical protein